ncbi:MAG: ankyrin repeat domain-containing protein [Pirellulaceae bacterium]
MRYFCGLAIVSGALLATGALATPGAPDSAGDTRFPTAGQPSALGNGDPRTAAASTSASSSLPISTGFRGHFSCRTFSGQNRELAAAVSDQQVARVAELLQAGADINARADGSHTRGMTLLQTAVWHRWGEDCVRLLIEAGAHLEARDGIGNTALVYACQSGPDSQLEVVESLLNSGAQVNARGAKGMTPLMHAAMQDHALQVLEALLRASADVNCQDHNGWTALMHCTRNRGDRAQVAQMLIAAGAQIDTTHRYGGTALLNAAYHGRSQVVESLLAAGANANIADQAGWTPLIGAAMNGHTVVVRSLLQAGAHVAATDRLGRSALALAKGNRHTAVVDLLVHRPTRKSDFSSHHAQ